MIKVVKRCEFPMPDGFKCNKPFKVSSVRTGRKYCDEHVGNDKRNAHQLSTNKLVTSSNAHAQTGNEAHMREWVMAKMRSEKKDKDRITKLEKEIARLEELFEKSEGNKKKIASAVHKEMNKPAYKEKIEGVLVKLLQKMNKRIDDIEIKMEEE
jgi:hypothetical protein